MITVRVEMSWDGQKIIRQTPESKGIWQNKHFTFDPVEQCDYLIIINHLARDVEVICPPQHIWQIHFEPPMGPFRLWHYGDTRFARTYTSDERIIGFRYHHTQPAIPWYLKQSYDELSKMDVPNKNNKLSCVTSNKAIFPGHKKRLSFISELQRKIDLDLFGKGFSEIENKFDGIAHYQYSLAVENFQNNYYFSEKLVDCFLTYTIPIYFGARKLEQFFPKNSFFSIDINHPQQAVNDIQRILSQDNYESHLQALSEARQLVLQKYQFFAFISNEINLHQNSREQHQCRSKKNVINKTLQTPFFYKITNKFQGIRR